MRQQLTSIFLFLAGILTAQNSTLKQKVLDAFRSGKFQQAAELVDDADPDSIRFTNLGLLRKHIDDILQLNYFHQNTINDTLSIVSFNNYFYLNQGLLNTKTKKYEIPPVYDKLQLVEKNAGIFGAFYNLKTGLVDVHNRTVMPFTDDFKDFSKFSGHIMRKNTDGTWNLEDYSGKVKYSGFKSYDVVYPRFLHIFYENKQSLIDMETATSVVDAEIIETNLVRNYKEIEERLLVKAVTGKKTKLYDVSEDQVTYLNTFEKIHFDENFYDTFINYYENYKIPDSTYNVRRNYFAFQEGEKFGIYNYEDNTIYKKPSISDLDSFGNGKKGKRDGNILYKYPVFVVNYGFTPIAFPGSNLGQLALLIEQNGKKGMMRYNGDVLIGPVYDEVIPLKSRFKYLSIALIRQNDKWGFIDFGKNRILKPYYDFVHKTKLDHRDAEEFQWIFYKNSRRAKIDVTKTNLTVPYRKNGYTFDLEKNPFYERGTKEYEERMAKKREEPAAATKKNNYESQLGGSKKKEVLNGFNSREKYELFGKVVNDGKKFGLWNQKQMPLIFDELKPTGKGIIARLGNRYGVIDRFYTTIIDFDYDEISPVKRGYIVKKNGKYGLIDNYLRDAMPIKYDSLYITDDFVGYRENGINKLALIQDTGFIGYDQYPDFKIGPVIIAEDNKALQFFRSDANTKTLLFSFTENGKTGIANHEGKIILAPKYDKIEFLKNYRASLTEVISYFLVTQNGKNTVIDSTSHTIFENAGENRYRFYTELPHFLILEDSSGKQGVYNLKERKITVPVQYHSIDEFETSELKKDYVKTTIETEHVKKYNIRNIHNGQKMLPKDYYVLVPIEGNYFYTADLEKSAIITLSGKEVVILSKDIQKNEPEIYDRIRNNF